MYMNPFIEIISTRLQLVCGYQMETCKDLYNIFVCPQGIVISTMKRHRKINKLKYIL
jgi:hypothetical protein